MVSAHTDASASGAAAPMKAARRELYQLSGGDAVRVTVFGEPDLSTTAKIGRDGAISLPGVGLAKIEGQTVREAARNIEMLLREYLVQPQVEVAVLAYSKRRFTIFGQVTKPGTYEIPEETKLDLFEAIGMAGGYTRLASPSRITVKRVQEGREALIKLDGKRMMREESRERFEILPGDTIVIGERIF